MRATMPRLHMRTAPLVFALLLSACSANKNTSTTAYPTYDPFVRADGMPPTSAILAGDPIAQSRGPTPTLAPISVTIPARLEGAPMVTATPDTPHALPTPRQLPDQYVVQPGDTLGGIAQSFGVGIGALLEANDLSEEDILSLGTTLKIPSAIPSAQGPAFKIIPDSELVFGPASAEFNIESYVSRQEGYLADYSEVLGIEVLSGSEIVERVARDYSVNPRLLLAVLEHRSHWVSQEQPQTSNSDYPLGLVHPSRQGLYRQLTWAANELNRGYYLWRANAVATWVLNDGTVIPIDPTINAGTAGLQHMLAGLGDASTWQQDATPFGLFQTYFFMFGNPFDLAIEPITGLIVQPALQLPFEPGVSWAFTGGPHAAWDSGSGWGALDFAPPDVLGCAVSQEWVTAAASGFVVRAQDGSVVQDLDGDGFEQTGWNILYMHVFEQDRVQAGTYVYAGERLGHPSCEGGISNASHLHLARKFNGEWIPADRGVLFQLGGWTSAGDGAEYDGFLSNGVLTLEADEGASEANLISR